MVLPRYVSRPPLARPWCSSAPAQLSQHETCAADGRMGTGAAACAGPATESRAQACLSAHLQQRWSSTRALRRHNTRLGLHPN